MTDGVVTAGAPSARIHAIEAHLIKFLIFRSRTPRLLARPTTVLAASFTILIESSEKQGAGRAGCPEGRRPGGPHEKNLTASVR